MLVASVPDKFGIPFANNAGGSYITYPIPQPSQISVQAGRASLYDGFPPVTFLPIGGGGTPPFGQDFNGLLFQVTAWNQWQQAGAPIIYDATFSGNIGGYPKGTVLQSAATPGVSWVSTVDNNTSDPDTGGANWNGVSCEIFATAGGVADALTATLPTFAAGLYVNLKNIASANATTTPVLNGTTITDRRGNALVAGDLPASADLQLLSDGTHWRNLGVVLADINPILGVLGTLNNVQQFVTTTRVTMAGNSGDSYTVVAWSPGNYTKKSSTSVLIIFAAGLTYAASSGPATGLLTVGSSTFPIPINNAGGATSSNTSTLMTTASGISSGSLALSLTYKRADSTTWAATFCPSSTDAAYLPTSTTGSIIIGEIGT